MGKSGNYNFKPLLALGRRYAFGGISDYILCRAVTIPFVITSDRQYLFCVNPLTAGVAYIRVSSFY